MDDVVATQMAVEATTTSDAGVDLRVAMGLFTPDDLAKMIGIGVRQLQVWRSEEIGPDYVKLGKQVFYRHEDIHAWIEANVVVTKRRGV
jgi:predicted DNA-binding transcriptional regulator AlpA